MANVQMLAQVQRLGHTLSEEMQRLGYPRVHAWWMQTLAQVHRLGTLGPRVKANLCAYSMVRSLEGLAMCNHLIWTLGSPTWKL
jgi:hypothetical protein